MKCAVCNKGSLKPGKTMVTLEHEGAAFVVRQVPARVCEDCGEAFVSEETSQKVLNLVKGSHKPGLSVEVFHYAA